MSTLAISFDPLRVDRARVHGWLSQEAYWSIGLGRTVFERAVDHSLVASAYLDDEQVGFARVVTDRATFAWLCDVFVAPSKRGQGIGTRLIAEVVAHPDLQGLRRWGLRTRDAHALYERFGFTALAEPQRAMERHNPHVYTPSASETAADRSTP
ncbi:MAG: family N-acetyltransferase [Burkholderiaceae bacterium]|jgi:GNAT superfamily N-acetyltransferase|nr:family N-acetyltransferase [Burkholderiaceae bacterium]